MTAKSTARMHMARIDALLEDCGECERCGREAELVVTLGQVNPDSSTEDRELPTCLACGLDLIVMLRRKGRLGR